MNFRPCIDLHEGAVKQIVGSTLREGSDQPVVNFTSDRSPGWYARKYRQDGLKGGHVIKLGPGNDEAAADALSGWPDGLQLGGGIDSQNASYWLDKGAEKVIVTSYVFKDGQIHEGRLKEMSKTIGSDKLVLDLSCRYRDGQYWIVTDRWQKFTSVKVEHSQLDYLSTFCCEFLIHAVDVEGKSRGIEKNLVQLLGDWAGIPITYAGGIHSWEDIETIQQLGRNTIDYTVGSALDIFGGDGLKYAEIVNSLNLRFHKIQEISDDFAQPPIHHLRLWGQLVLN